MARQEDEWTSFPLQPREFPTLQAVATAGNQKRRYGKKEKVGKNRLNLNWQYTTPTLRPNPPEWSNDDVGASNKSVEDTSFTAAALALEEEHTLKTVLPKFTDKATAHSRYETSGYDKLTRTLKMKIQFRSIDSSEQFRTLRLALAVQESSNGGRDADLCRPPDPSATPKWTLNLPDRLLTQEYISISYLRTLDIPLGPKMIELLKKKCAYLANGNRKLPIFKTDPIIEKPPPVARAPVKSHSQVSVHSDRSSSWQGCSNDVRLSGTSTCSNDVRLSGTSASSSSHDQYPQYGRQNMSSGMMEFRNSTRPNYKGNRREYVDKSRRDNTDSREKTKYGAGDNELLSSRLCYDYEWEDDSFEYPSNTSNRYNEEFGREKDNYRSENRIKYVARDDSGYHENDSRGNSYVEERSECVSPVSTPAEPVDTVRTEYSNKTPAWITEYTPSTGRKRDPSKWRARIAHGCERPLVEEKKREKSVGDLKRDEDPDARHFWKCVDVPASVRVSYRCLEGVLSNSCTAYADDMHRIELSTWSGEEDAAAVTERMREKFGIGQIEKEMAERVVHLALPRTSITLSVGAGGESEIIFDGDYTDVLVRGRSYDEVRDVIFETVLKTREFTSYSANRMCPDLPSMCTNTLITFATPEESREVRERLAGNGIDAKKIPRDLITGNWDGSYAKRECLLDLEWERQGTHGFSVRFSNLPEQANLVDRIMRDKSEYFMSAQVRIEEYFNRMYVSVPSSPFPIDDDIKFLKNLLEENGVIVTSIYPLNGRDGPQRIDSRMKQYNCKIAINRRILKTAMDEGVWGGFHPGSAAEWTMILEDGRFSWEVEIHNDSDLERKGLNSATVRFDSYEQGERIATQVQRMTPRPIGDERFILNKEDRKGVFARAKLRVHYNIPVHILALTKLRLKRLDEEWRRDSNFSHAHFHTQKEQFVKWVCLVSDDSEPTPPGFARLIVEGFPRRCVEDACAALLSVVRGDVIDCQGAESWLLTGVGRNMADVIAKAALEKKNVLIDFNVLGKEIRLIGEKYDTVEVEERLRRIVRRREEHVVKTLVSVRQPLYMNRASDAIGHCGGTKMMERVVGECRITACLKDVDNRTLSFEGTVAAFDRLRDFLADLDDTLRESAKEEYEKMRKTNTKLMDASLSPLTSALVCPICSCRTSADFYRLEACGHVYCTPCIYHQLHSELSSRTLPLVCRREGCGRKLAVSDLLRLLLGRDPEGGESGLEHLDEMKLRPLVTAIVTNALQTKRDRVIACRTADCAGIFPRHTEANSLVRCKTCERTTCGSCGYEPHRGYSCEEYEGLRDNVDVSIASYMKNKKVRKCPNTSCSAVIEKTLGCNHMECVLCRTHFCWLCGHASQSQGEIYAHMQNDHGGNGLHMDDGEMFMLQFDD